MRGDRLRLLDILEACAIIRQYTPPSRAKFDSDFPLRTHILFHIQVIGEAVSNVSESLRNQHPDIPWKAVSRMRNIIAHVYFGIDWDEVWRVACHDIAIFEAQIKDALGKLANPDEDGSTQT